jgi:hypothetical protein
MAEAQLGAAGGYKISEGPVIPASLPAEPADQSNGTEKAESPLLLALPRNPRELFVCWSVDWPAAFAENVPPDRQAHLQMHSSAEQRTIAVEPMSGSCIIPDLAPGQTYSVELGFYAPPRNWNIVATSNVVIMPFASEMSDDAIDVATIPFHLTFQRMLDVLGISDPSALMPLLARLQARVADESPLSAEDENILRSLELSPRDLRQTAAARAALLSSPSIGTRSQGHVYYGGSSEGFAESSWASQSGN